VPPSGAVQRSDPKASGLVVSPTKTKPFVRNVSGTIRIRSQAVPRQPTGATMKPSLALASHREAIRRVVASHRACNARVFGSVVHGNDTEASDLDILVDPTPETTLFDIGAIRHELLQLLGVPVDVLTPKALPEKLRASVLAEALPV
jgi:predicted nucleotidyltransferase